MINILYLLFAVILLGFIVMVHEFGHYITARLTGVRVEEFAVGMGPKIIGWRRNDIDYSLRAIPLGGFCRFVGEDEESDSPEAFAKQKRWKRFLILFSGAGMNFVLAYVAILVFLATFGTTMAQVPVIYGVVEGSPAQAAGVMPGDVVVGVNETVISCDAEGLNVMTQAIAESEGTLMLRVEREGSVVELQIDPYLEQEGEAAGKRQIGVYLGREAKASFAEAFQASGSYFQYYATAMIDGLRGLLFGQGLDQTMGPVGIITTIGEETREYGWQAVLSMMAMISLNLGIVNLLPLPALDGGRLVFLIVETIRRKPIPPEKEGVAHMIGFGLLLCLIVLVTYQDIARLIAG